MSNELQNEEKQEQLSKQEETSKQQCPWKYLQNAIVDNKELLFSVIGIGYCLYQQRNLSKQLNEMFERVKECDIKVDTIEEFTKRAIRGLPPPAKWTRRPPAK
eukprot:60229_1